MTHLCVQTTVLFINTGKCVCHLDEETHFCILGFDTFINVSKPQCFLVIPVNVSLPHKCRDTFLLNVLDRDAGHDRDVGRASRDLPAHLIPRTTPSNVPSA